MIKYTDYSIVLEEIPDRVTFAVNISNCQCRCVGCHSPHLREDIGNELTEYIIQYLFHDKIRLCNCFLFLGEGNDRESLLSINSYIKNTYDIETALYSGRDDVEDDLFDAFDYVKVGRYDENFGPINSPTTNQRLYYKKQDITKKMF